jgi:hypothetical protein
MKRYAVIFEESAQADVRESYDWVRLPPSAPESNTYGQRVNEH